MYIIIDGSSLAYKAWHSQPNKGFLHVPDHKGEINFVAGVFLGTFLWNLVSVVNAVARRKIKFTKVIICWDGSKCNYLRRELYSDYKKQRKKAQKQREFIVPHTFINIAREELTAIAGRYGLVDDYAEADDLIAILCELLGDQKKTIVTRDRDMFQLVNEKTEVYDPFSSKWFNDFGVVAELGVCPRDVVKYKSLVGDTSDNYPGVKGVGVKRCFEMFNGIIAMPEASTEMTICEKLAKLPFYAFNQDKFLDLLDEVDFDQETKWQAICEKWDFYPELQRQLSCTD